VPGRAARDLHHASWSPLLEEEGEVMIDTTTIREHMDVYGSCGKRLGRVDRAEARSIKLAKDAEGARGEHRYIPLEWVDRVDEHVHLNKPCGDVQEQWQAHPVQENEYQGAGK
jgi:hypothetical protein